MGMRKLVTALALGASTLTALPADALAHDHGRHRGHYKHHHYDGGYRERVYYEPAPVYYRERYVEPRRTYYAPRRSCRTSGTTGLIIGGAAGALLGRELDRSGDRAPGTIIGAGAGALVGRELARKDRC